MPQPLAHLYDLALRALDDQERRASELRSRVGPVLAAGGVGTTLLAGPAFSANPRGVVEIGAIAVAIIALLSTIGAAGYLLRASPTDDGIDVVSSIGNLALLNALDDIGAFYVSMIAALHGRQVCNGRAIRRLHVAFTVILCGILVELCGFAVAAVIG